MGLPDAAGERPLFRILVVSPEAATRAKLRETLQGRIPNAHVEAAADIASAVRQLEAERFDMVIADPTLPNGAATDLLARATLLARGAVLALLCEPGTPKPAPPSHPQGVLFFDRP